LPGARRWEKTWTALLGHGLANAARDGTPDDRTTLEPVFAAPAFEMGRLVRAGRRAWRRSVSEAEAEAELKARAEKESGAEEEKDSEVEAEWVYVGTAAGSLYKLSAADGAFPTYLCLFRCLEILPRWARRPGHLDFIALDRHAARRTDSDTMLHPSRFVRPANSCHGL
jgi:hypothetical protein